MPITESVPSETPEDIVRQADLMVECLMKELGRPGRWTARVAAWMAILAIRRDAESLSKERDYLRRGNASGGVAGLGPYTLRDSDVTAE